MQRSLELTRQVHFDSQTHQCWLQWYWRLAATGLRQRVPGSLACAPRMPMHRGLREPSDRYAHSPMVMGVP